MSPVGRAEAHRLWTSLQSEYERYQEGVREIPISNLKLQEDMRKYLCLRCAGFLEQVTFEIISEYLRQKSQGPVLEFARSFFHNSPNLTPNAFENLIGRFGAEKSNQFSDFLAGTNRDTLSDLLEVRNLVAHGRNMAGAKLDPSRYITLCGDVHDWLIDQFLGESVTVLGDDGKTVVDYERVQS